MRTGFASLREKEKLISKPFSEAEFKGVNTLVELFFQSRNSIRHDDEESSRIVWQLKS